MALKEEYKTYMSGKSLLYSTFPKAFRRVVFRKFGVRLVDHILQVEK